MKHTSSQIFSAIFSHSCTAHCSPQCDKILDIGYEEIGNIDPYSIFTPNCTGKAILSRNKTLKRLRSVGRIEGSYDPCTETHSMVYFNLPGVQKALHVNPAVAPVKWETCSDVVSIH